LPNRCAILRNRPFQTTHNLQIPDNLKHSSSHTFAGKITYVCLFVFLSVDCLVKELPWVMRKEIGHSVQTTVFEILRWMKCSWHSKVGRCCSAALRPG
jgi:hypothetical protein